MGDECGKAGQKEGEDASSCDCVCVRLPELIEDAVEESPR